MSTGYNEAELIEALLARLSEHVMGAAGAKIDLAGVMRIHAETGLGIRTVKRIVGMERAPAGYLPYHGTRDVLARYLGHGDWADFVRKATARAGASSASDPSERDGLPLPVLPEDIRYPNMPFRYLDWFRREDARIFFGRTASIQDLLGYLQDPLSDRVVLVYGQSGVGKSSFLHAGVLPRLEVAFETLFLRRESANSLLELLEAVAAVQSPKPVVAVIDQLDAVFVRGIESGLEELEAFCRELYRLVSRQGIRVILSFRKEYFAEVDAALARYGILFKRFFLQSLSISEIEDAITGITLDPGAMEKYQLSIDPLVPEKLLELLGSDRQSHMAPALQVVLTQLWLKATHLGTWPPAFTEELLARHIQPGAHFLGDFIDEALVEVGHHHPAALRTGLLLDILRFYVSEMGTARERTNEEVAARYVHVSEAMSCVHAMHDRRLLSDPAQIGKGVLRLAHDSLGPLVLHRLAQSTLPGQLASRLLDARSYLGEGALSRLWDESELAVIEAGLEGMRTLSEQEQDVLARSRSHHAARRKYILRRRAYRWLGGMLTVAMVFLLAYAGSQLQRRGKVNQSLFALRQAREILSEPEGSIPEAVGWYRQVLDAGIHTDSVREDLVTCLPDLILYHPLGEVERLEAVFPRGVGINESDKWFWGQLAYMNWLAGKWSRVAYYLGEIQLDSTAGLFTGARKAISSELGRAFLDSMDRFYLPTSVLVQPSELLETKGDSIPDFYLARTEISCRQFAAWLNCSHKLLEQGMERSTENNSQFLMAKEGIRLRKGVDPEEPAFVSWMEAMDYCNWFGWRLPTLLEWRVAASAGSGHLDHLSNGLDQIACYQKGFGDSPRPCKVGSYLPNPIGLYDMVGNAAEWLSDSIARHDISVFRKASIGGSYRNFAGDGLLSVASPPVFFSKTFWLDVGFRPVTQPFWGD